VTVYFFDTSAISKRYVVEIGSQWVKRLIHQRAKHTIIISQLTTVEFVSVMARRERKGRLSAADRVRTQNLFLRHVDNRYLGVELEKEVLRRARLLLVNHPLRSLDAIQLASALNIAHLIGTPITFVSADQRLLNAASAEGFATDEPNAHP